MEGSEAWCLQDFIKGSVAKSHYPSTNKPQDKSLSTHDVDGAQPKAGLQMAMLRKKLQREERTYLNYSFLSIEK